MPPLKSIGKTVRKERNKIGLDTFLWQGCPMILIADFGDNKEKTENTDLSQPPWILLPMVSGQFYLLTSTPICSSASPPILGQLPLTKNQC